MSASIWKLSTIQIPYVIWIFLSTIIISVPQRIIIIVIIVSIAVRISIVYRYTFFNNLDFYFFVVQKTLQVARGPHHCLRCHTD